MTSGHWPVDCQLYRHNCLCFTDDPQMQPLGTGKVAKRADALWASRGMESFTANAIQRRPPSIQKRPQQTATGGAADQPALLPSYFW